MFSVQSIMLKHKQLVAEFLTTNYDEFFRRYALLLGVGILVVLRLDYVRLLENEDNFLFEQLQ